MKKKVVSKKGKKNAKKESSSKILIAVGVIALCILVGYMGYYFFVENSNIKVNMSTDKKIEYVLLAGNEEQISTQKYVSDLEYSMRYDTENTRVFKYRNQDVYRFLEENGILVTVEKSNFPAKCTSSKLEMNYYNCYVNQNNTTTEYYIATNGKIYKVTVKHIDSIKDKTNDIVDYMLNSFTIIF